MATRGEGHGEYKSRVNSWILHVNTKYICGGTLDHMKFSFRGDRFVERQKLDAIDNLPDLYHLVRSLYDTEEKALKRIVYTLELVGHRRFGMRAVIDLDLDKYFVSLPNPKHDPTKDPLEVQLYQCLAQIACRLKVTEEENLRKIYAFIHGGNPEAHFAKDILSLLEFLVQGQKITIHDQLEFTEALYKSGASAQNTFKYIYRYRTRNHLQPMRDYLDLYPDYDPADDASSVTFDSDRSTPTNGYTTARSEGASSRMGRRRGISPLVRQITTPGSDRSRNIPSQQTTRQGFGTANSIGEPQAAADGNPHFGQPQPESAPGPNENTPLLGANPEQDRPRKVGGRVKIFIGALAALAMVALVGMGGAGYGVYDSWTHQYKDEISTVYSDSTIAFVDELLPYYLSNIKLSQDPFEYGSVLDMDLYLIDSSCGQLNTTRKTEHHSFSSQTELEELTGRYLLQGSTVSYNICALTNASDDDIFLQVYAINNLTVVRNLKVGEQIPHKYQVQPNYIRASNDTERCQYHYVHIAVDYGGYYSIRFVLNKPEYSKTMLYDYSMSIHQVEFGLPSPESGYVLYNCPLGKQPVDCSFPINKTSLHLPYNMNYEQCVLANIRKLEQDAQSLTGSDPNFSRINVHYQPYSINWLIMSASFLGAAAIVFIVVVIVEVVVCCKVCRKRN